ncbi:MAG: restriction endonuclease subunit S [Fusobacteriaceae bacterium]|nr:restriction endonuclease subunit S [Fusobacteriaceae bacterium]
MKQPLFFVVKKENILLRLDANFYHNPLVDEFLLLCKKNNVSLEDFGGYIEKAKRYPSFYGIPYLSDGVICFKGEAIDKDGFIIEEELSYIPEAINKQFPDTILDEGDIVFSVRGTIGKIFVVSKAYVGSNISANLIRLKLKRGNPSFLKYFLMSKYGQAGIERVSSGSLQYTITVDDIYSIKIPSLDPTEQDKIVNKIFKIEEEKVNYSKKYDSSIESLKDYLKTKISHEKKNFFIVSNKEVKDRIDCYSLSYELKKLISDLNKLKETHDLINGKDLKIVKRLNQEEFKRIATQEFKYFEVKHSSKQPNLINGFMEDVLMALPSRARQIIKENDILLPRPTLSTEKIAIVPKEFDGQVCSTGFIVIRPKDFDDACLLTSILKSPVIQRQLFLTQSGSIQPEISPNDFKKIIIPMPKSKQERERIIRDFKIKLKNAEDYRNKYNITKEEIENTFLMKIFSK